jgi:hypothetical protein
MAFPQNTLPGIPEGLSDEEIKDFFNGKTYTKEIRKCPICGLNMMDNLCIIDHKADLRKMVKEIVVEIMKEKGIIKS